MNTPENDTARYDQPEPDEYPEATPELLADISENLIRIDRTNPDDPEGLWPEYHRLELAELRAIRTDLDVLVSQFGEAVTLLNTLGEKAEGLFGNADGSPVNPLSMITGALFGRKG